MANYRVLTREELDGLSKEFIEFLVLNGITADDWETIKKDDHDNAHQIIEYFSEAIFEQIFRKAQFLRKVSEKEILCYQCLSVRIVVLGIRMADNKPLNFLTDDFDMMLAEANEGDFTIFHGKEKYSGKREHHMFDLTNQGFSISDGKYFKAISAGL